MNVEIAFGAIIMGLFLLLLGYLSLTLILPKIAKKDVSISIEAFRASFWLVIVGSIIIILGILYWMEIIPFR
jgi:hypothetical protein